MTIQIVDRAVKSLVFLASISGVRERPLALRDTGCDASIRLGSTDSRKKVIDIMLLHTSWIMDHDVVEDAKDVFFCANVEQDRRAVCV